MNPFSLEGSSKNIGERALDGIESVFAAVGLGQPPYGDVLRMLTGFIGTTLILYIMKPSFAFSHDVARPWILAPGSREAGIAPTFIPWWLPGMVVGFVFGCMI